MSDASSGVIDDLKGHAGASRMRDRRLSVNGNRVAAFIEELSELSEPGPGVTRLAYSQCERQAHERFAEWMESAGCAVGTDAAGNSIATRPGLVSGAAALATGSHLDSVSRGGRFDGVVGVVAALEIARMLQEGEVDTVHPFRFVAFAAEEGARFGQACIGSKLAAGLCHRSDLHECHDMNDVSVAEAMTATGFDPGTAVSQPWNAAEWAAFVELHIEQGSVLEQAGTDVGVVDLISGSTRLQVTCRGQSSHTGGTPMHARSDALAAAAEAVLLVEELARDARHHGTRATVGRLEVEPNSITTIPGAVSFTVDVRDVDADRQRDSARELLDRMRGACERRRVEMSVRVLGDVSPVVLPVWLRQELVAAAARVGVSARILTSGASHDAQMIGSLVPSAVLFVPSRAGLSHVPEEWTSISEVAAGIEVLLEALLAFDELLSPVQAAGHPRDGRRADVAHVVDEGAEGE